MIRLMPFGKYEGSPIQSVPRKYLQWLANEGKLYGQLREDVERTLAGLRLLPPQADRDETTSMEEEN